MYEAKVRNDKDFISEFDLAAAVKAASSLTGQKLTETHHE
jgi:hypothetical protein